MTENENQALMQCLGVTADSDNCPIAAFYYGQFISEDNPPLASSYLLKAAKSGVEEAQTALNELNPSTSTTSNKGEVAFKKGNEWLSQHKNVQWEVYLKAAECFEEAIQQGYGQLAQEALNDLVKDLEYFVGRPDPHYGLAYQSSNIPVLLYIGNKNMAEKLSEMCFKKAAERGDTSSMLKVARTIKKTAMHRVDESALLEAVEYYAMAIKSGNKEVANELKNVLIEYEELAKKIVAKGPHKRRAELPDFPITLSQKIVTKTVNESPAKALDMLDQISEEEYLLYMAKKSLWNLDPYRTQDEDKLTAKSKALLLLERTNKLITSGKIEAAQEIVENLLTTVIELKKLFDVWKDRILLMVEIILQFESREHFHEAKVLVKILLYFLAAEQDCKALPKDQQISEAEWLTVLTIADQPKKQILHCSFLSSRKKIN